LVLTWDIGIVNDAMNPLKLASFIAVDTNDFAMSYLRIKWKGM